MSRFVRRPRQSHPIAELNVTNLIDLGFTLLIIFMIATPLINQEQTIPVNLPIQSPSEGLKPDPKTQFIAVTIREQGDYFIDQQLVTLSELRTRLKALGANPANIVIRIRADGNVPYQKIISLIDDLKQNNLNKVTFDTQAGA
ncbi:biopolymer transport protein TolR [Ereboglobus sp. PH5-5]|uniref:ExbD/TolR family protein n=1 Tax=unclassified Ereboglobus TaxID=2626932 RepID=UPI0024068458|nr:MULTISPECIES: biopolymer transporter ExbD [unclassified Ereboglobus]MDF9826362.1 biopolymer transport protein TolR [Ereboglobus sp. PH5-10]MDF9833019.1 biopolymer transport protein TolR [Ereboglobus sp. PH5-5]